MNSHTFSILRRCFQPCRRGRFPHRPKKRYGFVGDFRINGVIFRGDVGIAPYALIWDIQKAARKYLAGGLCRKNASQAQLRLYAYENLPQLSAVISRKATGEDLLFAPAAAGKQRLCMKPRAGQKQYGTKQPAGVGARPFESIFYGSVLSILRASAANSGSIVRRLCDFSSPISSCISVIDFPCARR